MPVVTLGSATGWWCLQMQMEIPVYSNVRPPSTKTHTIETIALFILF